MAEVKVREGESLDSALRRFKRQCARSGVLAELRKRGKVTSQSSEDTYQSLSKYAINLNEAARSGKLDPAIGRDEEIRRVLQILSRRTKNNPILIGEAGVGKTAIVEELSRLISIGKVPNNLKNKRIKKRLTMNGNVNNVIDKKIDDIAKKVR